MHSAGRGAATFVNAVLRRVSERDLDAWLAVLRAEAPDAASALAAVESHPRWMVKAMRQALLASGRSEEELEALIKRQAWLEHQPKCDRPSCDGKPHAGAPYPHDPTYLQAADPLESAQQLDEAADGETERRRIVAGMYPDEGSLGGVLAV